MLSVLSVLSSAADLVVDDRTEILEGEHDYDHVRVRNHGRIEATGDLVLRADSLLLDLSSSLATGGTLTIEAADLVLWGSVTSGGALLTSADRVACTGILNSPSGEITQRYDALGETCGSASAVIMDWDGDGASAPGDCATRDPLVGPFATESCNGIDDDCDGEVDEDVCACPVSQYGGHAYEFCSADTTDWSSAQALCFGSGKHLVAIEDATEDTWLQGEAFLVLGTDGNWWIGYNDIASETDFVWDGGSQGTYTNWLGGYYYLNYGATQDCADFRTWSDWADRECSASLRYMCESCTRVLSFADGDGDGYGDPAKPEWACFGPGQEATSDATDCNDDDVDAYPGAYDPWGDRNDADCNGIELWEPAGTGDTGTASTGPDTDSTDTGSTDIVNTDTSNTDAGSTDLSPPGETGEPDVSLPVRGEDSVQWGWARGVGCGCHSTSASPSPLLLLAVGYRLRRARGNRPPAGDRPARVLPVWRGPRKCIGAHFATMEATRALASVARRFSLQLLRDHPIVLQPAVTLRPATGSAPSSVRL